ncbi:pyroglutamyl-peptidase I [Staphylococcus epidermidis]|uniref:pyroglutamyl-peptidase I family protein n=1 Tax=Staphylococcus epidermidis TaxID=1282 RepID=UPI0028796072|nr:pyroglutamyl-peptidase I [Staphylococcus epidermidis]MDS3956592.1 pyroglutamyl-peptidase I [Staphylococcus epidermidis]
MEILVTAFEPFGDKKINSALEAVSHLETKIGCHKIDRLILPTVFHDSADMIAKVLKSKNYDVALAIGQAGGRSEITPERVGINIDDAPAYFSNLPIKRMTMAIQKAGLPSRLSNSAGTFVCNHILYQLGYMADHFYPDLLLGFIHVPLIPEQTINHSQQSSMSVEDIVKGLTEAIKAIDFVEDNKIALGEIQ